MLNYHKIFSIGLGLLFMVVLQVFSTPQPIFRFLLPAFLGVLAITFFYNRWYLRQLGKYNFWIIIRPLLLETSGFFVYLLLFDSFSRGVMLVISVFLIAGFEIMLANFSESVMLNETLIAAFGFCFAFFGFLWWVPPLSYLYFAGLFLSLFLLARCFYDFLPQDGRAKWMNALTVSFLSIQVFWAASFLPFHYSALSILVLNFFYLALVLNYHNLFHTLTAQKVKFYFSLSIISLVVVFSATPWTIID